jgi:hypothetical protein
LNSDFGISNGRQGRKIGTVCVPGWEGCCGRQKGNEGDEGEGIWLMSFIYMYKIEQ